jgi:hypothetical protein
MLGTSSEKDQDATVSVAQALGRIAALAAILPSRLAGLSLSAVAERLYSQRRERDRHFPPRLFGEPAWDLLLALFVAREEGRTMSLAEAYQAAVVTPPAGRRLITKLEAEGWIVRCPVSGKPQRLAVGLTQHSVERLSDYLTELL